MSDTDALAPLSSFSAANTFVRVAEVWTPDQTGTTLTLASGLYGDLAGFAEVSGTETFARGEGLPGRAWAEARPVILKGFRGANFKRTEAAEAAGLTAAIALPVFQQDTLKAVVTFFFADDASTVGAVEVWTAASASSPMALEDGHYGHAEHFEWISRHTAFPKGSGLPGTVWASGAPVVFHDLGGSHRFLRSTGAAEAGLTAGLGIPMPISSELAAEPRAVTLLSALGTPFARKIEVYSTGDGHTYMLVDGFGDGGADLPPSPSGRTFVIGEGPLGEAAVSGQPVAQTIPDAGPGAVRSFVAYPIHDGPRVAHMIVWYF